VKKVSTTLNKVLEKQMRKLTSPAQADGWCNRPIATEGNFGPKLLNGNPIHYFIRQCMRFKLISFDKLQGQSWLPLPPGSKTH